MSDGVDPAATVIGDVTIGENCRIEAGAVIGCHGFGYTWTGDRWERKPEHGGVVLRDNVHVGRPRQRRTADLSTRGTLGPAMTYVQTASAGA